MAAMVIFVCDAYCFLPHPCGMRTHWIRTARCVAFVDCEFCGAKRGELCVGATGPVASTHTMRREDYQRRKKVLEPARSTEKLIVTIEGQ